MPPYRIANPKIVERFVRQHPQERARILEALGEICVNPIGPPPNQKHLRGQFLCNWRKRFGDDFRIRYSPNAEAREIRILAIGSRSNFYD